MPVTHGVAGSSPVRTAKKTLNNFSVFFLFYNVYMDLFFLGRFFFLLKTTTYIFANIQSLFLNNAINHGVLGPIGIEQAQQAGKSIMFLLEANPDPY